MDSKEISDLDKKKLLVYSTQLMITGGIESHINVFIDQMYQTQLYDIDLLVLNSQLTMEQELYLSDRCWVSVFMRGKKNLFSILKIVNLRWFRKYDALYTNGQGDSIFFVKKMFQWEHWVHHHHTSGDKGDQDTWTPKYIHTLKQAPELIACSSKNARDMSQALGRTVNTIPVFSNDMSDVERDKSLNEKPEKIHLAYFGRLIPEKGIDLLCKLSEEPELNFISFHIWGEGAQYSETFFEKYPYVSYHGKFSGKEELKRVLASIDGFLLLSVHPEGLPVSLLELMGAGVPWMATNKGGISDIALDDMGTRVIESLTPYENLKTSVFQFAQDIKLGRVSNEMQKQLYQSKFSSEVLVKAWNQILFKEIEP